MSHSVKEYRIDLTNDSDSDSEPDTKRQKVERLSDDERYKLAPKLSKAEKKSVSDLTFEERLQIAIHKSKNAIHAGAMARSNVIGVELNVPPKNDDNWKTIASPPDGNCFYWTLLRGFRFLNIHDNIQTPLDIRRKLMCYLILNDDNAIGNNEKKCAIERIQLGICQLSEKQAVSSNAWALGTEANICARLFGVCLVIWNPNPGYWTASFHHRYAATLEACPNIIYMVNTNENHFDYLERLEE